MGSSLLILDHLWALRRKSEYSSSHRFMQIQKTSKNCCKSEYSSSHRFIKTQKTYKSKWKINFFKSYGAVKVQKGLDLGGPGSPPLIAGENPSRICRLACRTFLRVFSATLPRGNFPHLSRPSLYLLMSSLVSLYLFVLSPRFTF